MGTGCWYTCLPHCSCSTHHSNLKQLMIPYQLLQQQAGRRGATLQHVDSVGIGMLWACWLWHTDFLSHRIAYTQATRRLFVHVGLVWIYNKLLCVAEEWHDAGLWVCFTATPVTMHCLLVTAHHSWTISTRYLKIVLLHCIGWNVQHGMGVIRAMSI